MNKTITAAAVGFIIGAVVSKYAANNTNVQNMINKGMNAKDKILDDLETAYNKVKSINNEETRLKLISDYHSIKTALIENGSDLASDVKINIGNFLQNVKNAFTNPQIY